MKFNLILFIDSPAARRAPNNWLSFENVDDERTMLIARENVAIAITKIEIEINNNKCINHK